MHTMWDNTGEKRPRAVLRRRLLCLNLALLLLCSLALPARAAVPEDFAAVLAELRHDADAVPAEGERWQFSDAETMERAAGAVALRTGRFAASDDGFAADGETDARGAGDSSAVPYHIIIDGTHFYSNEIRSGSGWSYDGSGTLTLNNGYRGSGITASGGDLIVYSSGTVSVSAPYRSSGNGSDALVVKGGVLELYVVSGTLSLAGGSTANGMGGNGIFTGIAVVTVRNGAAVHITGGNGPYGGDAVLTSSLFILDGEGTGSATLTGGTGTYDGGGSAAYSNQMIISCNATLRGGSGVAFGGPSVWYSKDCQFGRNRISLYGGQKSGGSAMRAIYAATSSNLVEYASHTTHSVSGSNNETVNITVNRYRLTLDGSGGTRDGNSSVTLEKEYPGAHTLGDYVFSRGGYEQVAWTDASGNTVSLTETYSPEKNETLTAKWKPVELDMSVNGCEAWAIPATKTIRLIPSADWIPSGTARLLAAAYTEAGVMQKCQVSGANAGEITLSYRGGTIPQVRLFAVDSLYRPLKSSLTLPPPIVG